MKMKMPCSNLCHFQMPIEDLSEKHTLDYQTNVGLRLLSYEQFSHGYALIR